MPFASAAYFGGYESAKILVPASVLAGPLPAHIFGTSHVPLVNGMGHIQWIQGQTAQVPAEKYTMLYAPVVSGTLSLNGPSAKLDNAT